MNGETTIYYPSSEFSSAEEAKNNGWFYASNAECTADGYDSCTSGTVTLSAGDYTTDASTLNKNYYLKHTVVNDIITASYVCFVTDTEHCMQGGDPSFYSANVGILQTQESWFNSQGGSCTLNSSGSDSYCYGGGFDNVATRSGGYAEAIVGGSGCSVARAGNSDCT